MNEVYFLLFIMLCLQVLQGIFSILLLVESLFSKDWIIFLDQDLNIKYKRLKTFKDFPIAVCTYYNYHYLSSL